MAVNFKTCGALILTASTAVFAFKQLSKDGDLVVSNLDLSEPHSEKELKEESTWDPEIVPYKNEVYETVGLDNSDNGSPYPTKYRYASSRNSHDFLLDSYSEEQKVAKRAEATKIYGTLNDYTFKFFMPCGFGTGWILDYQLTDDNSYPTKWYIATNAHVIWRLNFGENTYNQKLPRDDFWTKHLRGKSGYENVKNHKGLVREKCEAVDKLGYVDFNISQPETGKLRNADVGGVVQKQIKEPKLFYSAFDFLKGQVEGKHFADFAVLEIEFTSQDEAKRATNDFANKYKGEADVINLFGDPIEKKYKTKEELWKARDNYYIFGYAGMEGVDKWIPTANFNNNTAIASHLADWIYNDQSKDKYKGFVSVKDSGGYYKGGRKTFDWNGEGYYEFGHRYKFRENPLAPGSSGAMYVDGDGTAVGIIVRTTGNKYGDRGNIGSSSWAQPFRSVGGITVDGIVTPKYDLILGVEGQTSSYKKQVQEYILKKGDKTWLSQKPGWNSNPTAPQVN